jgi:hypothetical protein
VYLPYLVAFARAGRFWCLSSRGDEHVGAWKPNVLYVLMELDA